MNKTQSIEDEIVRLEQNYNKIEADYLCDFIDSFEAKRKQDEIFFKIRTLQKKLKRVLIGSKK